MSAVHLWAPDLLSTGGIQRFSRHFLGALTDVVPSNEIRVLLKNDVPANVRSRNSFHRIKAFGDWPVNVKTAAFSWACLRSCWRDHPRLIASMHLNFGPLARIASELTGAPYLLVAHGIDAWRLDGGARVRALYKADVVFAVSRYTRERLIERFGLAPEKVVILPNTFLPENFRIAAKSSRLLAKYGLSADNPIILTVCRLAGAERYKGYDQIVRALPEIRRELPDVRYLLVGAGPDRARIENLAIEIGVRDAVVFTGSVSDAELSDHYNLCDLFAMPSKAEGFGIVYLEALACGKPVIAGNKDGSADALANGDLGLLLDPDDIAAIAREAVRVLRKIHPHPKIFRPEVLRARVTELFGFDTFGLKLRALLKPFLEQDAGEKLGADVNLESRALDRVSVPRSNYHSPDPQDSAVV